MASETVYFSGKCQWAKLFKPDMKFAPGAYKVDIFLDKEQIKAFKALKLRNQVKVDDDGNQYVSLARKVGVKPWAKDEEWGPPVVVDKDGNKLDKLIGNGSEITVQLEVYESQLGRGSRLEKVVVTNLVPYEKAPEGDPSADVEDEKPKSPAAKIGEASSSAARKPAGLPF